MGDSPAGPRDTRTGALPERGGPQSPALRPPPPSAAQDGGAAGAPATPRAGGHPRSRLPRAGCTPGRGPCGSGGRREVRGPRADAPGALGGKEVSTACSRRVRSPESRCPHPHPGSFGGGERSCGFGRLRPPSPLAMCRSPPLHSSPLSAVRTPPAPGPRDWRNRERRGWWRDRSGVCGKAGVARVIVCWRRCVRPGAASRFRGQGGGLGCGVGVVNLAPRAGRARTLDACARVDGRFMEARGSSRGHSRLPRDPLEGPARVRGGGELGVHVRQKESFKKRLGFLGFAAVL